MAKLLTPAQDRILRFVASRNPQPSRREICEHFCFTSTNAAADHLTALMRKGMIEDCVGKARSYPLTEKGWAHIESAWSEDERIAAAFLRGFSLAELVSVYGWQADELEAALRRKLETVRRRMSE